MGMVQSVDLSIWTDDGENVELNLEPWQVSAIIQVLGIRIEPTYGGAYDVTMYGPQTIRNILRRLDKMKRDEIFAEQAKKEMGENNNG